MTEAFMTSQLDDFSDVKGMTLLEIVRSRDLIIT